MPTKPTSRQLALASLIATVRRTVRTFYNHEDFQELRGSLDAYDIATGRLPERFPGESNNIGERTKQEG